MRIKMLITMLLLAAALPSAPVAFAQNPQRPGKGKMQQQMANLTPDERTKLKAARQKAMQDSTVQAAREKMRQAAKEFHDAMRAAMLKADPTIQPLLDKMPMGAPGEPHED